MNEPTALSGLPEPRQAALRLIKRSGGATARDVASELGITSEGARQHLIALERDGWIERTTHREEKKRSGRPFTVYILTPRAVELLPKRYDELSISVLQTVEEELGEDTLLRLLTAMTDKEVERWESRLRGLDLRGRLEALRSFYHEEDSFLTVHEEDDELYLIETNCPIRQAAMKFPQLCSTSISALTRLIGHRIERTSRFQHGDGRCVFRVLRESRIDPKTYRFELEPEGEDTPE